MNKKEALETNEFKREKMYLITKGQAKDGEPKTIYIENGKAYVYHKQNSRGVFFMVRDAVKRYNSL